MVYLKCSDVVDKISEIIDLEATMMTRMRFHSHLMMCNNCRRYFEQFKTVKELAGKISPGDLPEDLSEDFEQVMKFVMNEIEKKDV